ncbi:MAG TPA: acyltransferase [Bryobacteraceae bacterium]|nr:acyltransferase [Bryobacteraceae bacterium]
MTPQQGRPKAGVDLPALDGWRAVAITLVLFAHMRFPGDALATAAPYGAMGVHLFFAISGLLITHRLLEEESLTGRIGLRGFYIRRAFRILPAATVYLAVLCVLGFLLRWIPLSIGQIASSALFFRNYWVEPAAQSWYTGHYWSLSVEEHFYLVWPGLLVLIGTRRARWTVPVLACLFALWRAADSHFGWIANLNPALRAVVGRTDYRMDGLLWGCAAAFLWHSRFRNWLAARGRSEYALIPVFLITALLVVRPPGYVALLALLMPVPLLFTASQPKGFLTKPLDSAAARWLGQRSYSVYLWQMLFLPAYGIPVAFGWVQQFPWNLVFVLACASAGYYLVERPMRRWGRRLASSRFTTARKFKGGWRMAASFRQ